MAVSKSKRRRGPRQAPKTGYRFLEAVLNLIDDGPVLDALGPATGMGRPGFSRRAMLRLVLSKYVLKIQFNVDLLTRLRASSVFRRICGFQEKIPSESTLSRFISKLGDVQEVLERRMDEATEELRDRLPGFGRAVAVDSSAFETWSNPNRKVVSDPDARWGFKNSPRTKDGDPEYVFGYKVHLLSDADYGLPLTFYLTPANENDQKHLAPLLKKAGKTLPWLKPRYLLADKGYDSLNNHKAVVSRGIVPVIHIRKEHRSKGLHKGVYSDKGSPTCLGMTAMDYIRTDRETGHHLFRCPADGCHLKDKPSGSTRCDSEVWEDPAANLRVVGILPRASAEWKRQYNKRMSIERIFGSVKHSRLLDQHRYRGLRKVRLHATLSFLTYQLTALARVKAGDVENLRMMRV